MPTGNDGSGPRPPAIPPDADATPQGQWVPIGSVSPVNGQILIIANHAAEPDAQFDYALAHAIRGNSRSADGRIMQIIADQYAPGEPGGHADEEILIIRTWETGVHVAEAPRCGTGTWRLVRTAYQAPRAQRRHWRAWHRN